MQPSLIRSVTRKIFGLVFICAACLVLQVMAADDTDTATANQAVIPDQPSGSAQAEVTAQDQEKIEEITVIGQKDIFDLRHKVIKAEDRAYNIFNKLVDDKSFAVHCQFKATTGSLIKRRVCLPDFYYDALRGEALSTLATIGYFTNSAVVPSARNVFAMRFPAFKNKVKELVMKDPDLRDAMKNLFELTHELKQNRAIYHGLAEK